jgi:hypothetical protein
MIKVRIDVLGPTCLLTAAIMAGCGGGGDPSVHRAAERCVEQAQNMPAESRSSIEAACGRMQTYCDDEARRKDKLCEQFLLRYK